MAKEKVMSSTAWIQLSAGQGPKECGWVVAQLLRVILQDALKKSLTAELVERLPFDKPTGTEEISTSDAYLSVLIRLEGNGTEEYAQEWIGSVKWQGVSRYRPKHKRTNWFIGVERVSLTGTEKIDMNNLISEIDVKSMRSGGPGGQHVNKTNSAIRITHRPTGIQVRVETDRSQHRNRQLAMERLQMILAEGEAAKGKAQVRDRWLKHYQVNRGNPVRVFQGSEFKEKI